MTIENTEDIKGDCWNCGAPCVEAEWCDGCKEFLCRDCDSYGVSESTDHRVEAHL